jgi:hypothetical protein
MKFRPSKETRKRLHELAQEQEIANRIGELSRARSVTVGTSFGGTTEVSMRSNDGTHVWCILQPVEAIELIHQLAANVGCHIHIQPRDDFSSWRGWREMDKPPVNLNGHPPFSNAIPNADTVGANLPPPEEQPGMIIDRSSEDVVATKKTVNRRSTKRAPKTA